MLAMHRPACMVLGFPTPWPVESQRELEESLSAACQGMRRSRSGSCRSSKALPRRSSQSSSSLRSTELSAGWSPAGAPSYGQDRAGKANRQTQGIDRAGGIRPSTVAAPGHRRSSGPQSQRGIDIDTLLLIILRAWLREEKRVREALKAAIAHEVKENEWLRQQPAKSPEEYQPLELTEDEAKQLMQLHAEVGVANPFHMYWVSIKAASQRAAEAAAEERREEQQAALASRGPPLRRGSRRSTGKDEETGGADGGTSVSPANLKLMNPLPERLLGYPSRQIATTIQMLLHEKEELKWHWPEWKWGEDWEWGGLTLNAPAKAASRPADLLNLSDYHLSNGSLHAAGGSWQKLVKSAASVDKIVLRSNSLGPEVVPLLQPLSLLQLDLGKNRIGPAGGQALAEMLQEASCSLRSLDISNNRLLDEGLAPIMMALKECSGGGRTLQTLLCSGNGIKGASSEIYEGIRENYKIQTLDLSWNRIQGKAGSSTAASQMSAASSLMQALSENSGITALDLSYNNLCTDGLWGLARIARDSTSIRSIGGAYCGCRSSAALPACQALAAALKASQQLTALDLTGNSLTMAGTSALIEAEKANPKLK
ncbi:unnamed protein product, partial [Chrysoparadoxa australica]